MESLTQMLSQYIIPVVMLICLIVGYIVKQWIKDVDNKFIPTIVTILGVFIAVWNSGWVVSPDVILTGLASGLASTGLYELVTQYLKKSE